MAAHLTEFSKHQERQSNVPGGVHGIINNYIARYHHNPEGFTDYRRRWDSNKSDLLFVLLETVSICNLRCPMCVQSAGYDIVDGMDEKIFDVALDGIRQMKIPSVCMNATNEPLLDKKIFERLRKVSEIQTVVDVHMNTNAVLLNDDNSRKILDSGLTRLLIGFDAFTKETYNKTRVGADYDQVLGNVLNFLEMKERSNKTFPVVRISLVRTSENEHEINDWVAFWKDKVDYVVIQEFITPVLDGSRNYLLASSMDRRRPADIREITCMQPSERVTIRGNGDVLPCCAQTATKMPIGNLGEQSLQEIWNGARVRNLRRMFQDGKWMDHPICGPCLKLSYGIFSE